MSDERIRVSSPLPGAVQATEARTSSASTPCRMTTGMPRRARSSEMSGTWTLNSGGVGFAAGFIGFVGFVAERRPGGVKYHAVHVGFPVLPDFLEHVEKADHGVCGRAVRCGKLRKGVESPECKTVAVDEKQFFPLPWGSHPFLFSLFGSDWVIITHCRDSCTKRVLHYPTSGRNEMTDTVRVRFAPSPTGRSISAAAHRPVQLAVGAAHGRKVHSQDRGHRPGAVHQGIRGNHHVGHALARPRLGRRPRRGGDYGPYRQSERLPVPQVCRPAR